MLFERWPSRSGKALTVVAAALALAACSTMSVECETPSFSAGKTVIDPERQGFNPTGEFIFPSVFHAAEYLTDPLGEWYLYYSPHERPGGIALAYSDSLDGPWTEFDGNPIVSTGWSELASVSHVSSADVVWNAAEGQAVMYFHGENDTTRFALSSDGLDFRYGGIALEAGDVGATTTEVSYARVFPDPAGDGWAMFFMENSTDGTRTIDVARSTDGLTWEADPRALIVGDAQGDADVSGANLWVDGDRLRVVYHSSSGAIHSRTVNAGLTEVGDAVELFAGTDGSDATRVAAPELVRNGDTLHMFYESGPRLSATIAATTATCG